MPKTCIIHEKLEHSPTQMADANAAIECVGWWKPGDWITSYGGSPPRGSGLYHVTRWDDSSGKDNHLVSLTNGPVIYGGGTDPSGNSELGDSGDQVGGESVLDFTNDASEDGTGLSSFAMGCNPDVDADFSMGGADNGMVIVAVVQHFVQEDAVGWSYGDWQGIVAADRAPSHSGSGDDEWMYGLVNHGLDPDVNFVQQMSHGSLEAATTGTDVIDPNGWAVMGISCTGKDASDYMSESTIKPNTNDTEDESPSLSDWCGVGVGATLLYIPAAAMIGQSFRGRMVELAILKTSEPIATVEITKLMNFFVGKYL